MTRHQQNKGAGITRRRLIGTSAATLGAAGLASVSLASPLRPRGPQRDVIVSVYLRGALDGLSAVVPYGDGDYGSQRGALAIGAPGTGPDAALDLDGFFGLHPAGSALLRPYGDNKLAFVHASGIASPNRSHFDAQRRMETGTPDMSVFPESTGWMGRHLATSSPSGTSLLRGIGIGNLLATTLVGGPGTLPVSSIDGFDFPGRNVTSATRRAVLDYNYDNGPAITLPVADATLEAIDILESVDYGNYVPEPGAIYPPGSFGEALRQVAALIKAGVDIETAQINLGGWDHHADLLPRFTDGFEELANGLDAFYVDMQNAPAGYTLLAQTEFGRRVAPNGSDGTDHGFASCMFAMGPNVIGGRVMADWPGMSPDTSPGSGDGDLVNGDLDVTIDWRDIAAEILDERAGGADLAAIFPGYSPTFRGIV